MLRYRSGLRLEMDKEIIDKDAKSFEDQKKFVFEYLRNANKANVGFNVRCLKKEENYTEKPIS